MHAATLCSCVADIAGLPGCCTAVKRGCCASSAALRSLPTEAVAPSWPPQVEQAYRVEEFDMQRMEEAEEERVRLAGQEPRWSAGRPHDARLLTRTGWGGCGCGAASPLSHACPAMDSPTPQEAEIDDDEEANVVADWDQVGSSATLPTLPPGPCCCPATGAG